MLLAAIPTLLGLVASGVLAGWQVALGIAEPVFLTGADFIPFGVTILVQLSSTAPRSHFWCNRLMTPSWSAR